ncbi:MAG TPA: peptide deformylase [Candidatus Omnitrophota bacterium]|nr:peptide deformylase [Candidatus Omnitrophota bacterium]
MLMKIIQLPNPILRKKAKSISKIDQRIRKLIEDMIETLHAAPGVGLAAPQVGESVRLVVIDVGEGAFALINPKIKKRSRALQTFDEGCLSMVGLVGTVARPSKVTVEGLDKNGEKLVIDAEGFLATVLQHEIDHLNGTMFVDHIKDPELIRMVTKKEEEDKQELI